MQIKTLQILAGVTVPVAALAMLMPNPSTTPAPARGAGLMLWGLAANITDGTEMVVTGPDETTKLRHTGGKPDAGWVLADHGGYKVPTDKIKPVLEGLEKLRGLEPKTARPKLYDRLDVGNPGAGSQSHEVAFTSASGKPIVSLILGRTKEAATTGHDRIYVRVPGQARTWLAEPAITLPAGSLDWINRGVLDLDPDKIKQITITQAQPGAPVLTLGRAKPGDKLALENLPPGDKPKPDTTGADIAPALQGLELADVEPAAALKAAPIATVHAVMFDGLAVDLALAKQNNQIWMTVSASGGKEAADISARTKGWAYQIAEAKAVPLQTKLADLVIVPPPAAPHAPPPAPAVHAQPTPPVPAVHTQPTPPVPALPASPPAPPPPAPPK